MLPEALATIRQAFQNQSYELSLHARFRMAVRGISLDSVEQAGIVCEIVKQDLQEGTPPKYWIEGENASGIMVGMIVSMSDRVFVRTVFWPGEGPQETRTGNEWW